MIVSEKPDRSNSRGLPGIVLLCAMVVLFLGIASAQDYDAVGKRLRAAVAADELTPQQARAMMDTLRRTAPQAERKGIGREDDARAEGERGTDLRERVSEGVRSGSEREDRRKKPATSTSSEEATPTEHRGSYALNGRIHVGLFGHPDGQPLTTGPSDMKPSWSKEGDMLVFFRVTKPAPRIPDWKTAICVVKTDGTGFRKLTDGTHTDFNPTWTRDGSHLVVLNRQNPEGRGFTVMLARSDSQPGEEYAVSDTSHHTYAYSCLQDGRMLVSSSRLPSKGGYFLMTPDREGNAKYEPIECEMAKQGRLDRISIAPDETKVCFEFQRGFGEYRYPGRGIYLGDFDAKTPAITNPKLIANEAFDQNVTYLYPRWTKDQSAVVYHCNRTSKNQLYLYRLKDGSTIRVSTNADANYMFPHGEATPK